MLTEWHDFIEDAIQRGKRLKAWKRAWKIEFIEAADPIWQAMFEHIID